MYRVSLQIKCICNSSFFSFNLLLKCFTFSQSVLRFYFHQWLCSIHYNTEVSPDSLIAWTAPGQLFVSAKWVCVLHRIFCLFCVSSPKRMDIYAYSESAATYMLLLLYIKYIYFDCIVHQQFFCEIVLFLLYLYIRCINVALVQHLICVDFNWFFFLYLFSDFLFYFIALSMLIPMLNTSHSSCYSC